LNRHINDADAKVDDLFAVAVEGWVEAAVLFSRATAMGQGPSRAVFPATTMSPLGSKIGKQLLITRGALTTFSLANDVSKYFAIIPAAFSTTYPELDLLNVMRLATPASAILSAVIFNALIIVALIPLALRGVKYRPVGAATLLRDNLLLYGVGGLIVPFLGIKLIDLLLVALGLT
jgi:K+-transporting ATPase ATPase B chain